MIGVNEKTKCMIRKANKSEQSKIIIKQWRQRIKDILCIHINKTKTNMLNDKKKIKIKVNKKIKNKKLRHKNWELKIIFL